MRTSKIQFIFLFVLGLFVYHNNAIAQKIVKVNPGDAILAQEYKEVYPEEEVISLEASTEISFLYNKKESLVSAKVKEDETLLCLQELTGYFTHSIFLNDQVTVSRISGYNYRKKQIMYYSSESSYKSSGIFYDDVKVKSFGISFSRIGDRNRYVYKKTYKDVKYLTKAFFHTYYPLKSKTIVITIPSWLEVDLIEQNFENFEVNKTEAINDNGDKVITYVLDDLKPIHNEKLSSGYAISLPHVMIVAKEYTQGGQTTTLFKTTADLYGWYASLIDDLDNQPDDFEAQVNKLTTSASTDEEKIKNIFYWVQDNVRYIAYEDGIMGFKPATAQDVYNKKFGDCKGMANLTCEMLKVAGFDSRLTWIGTRRIPYTYDIPSLAVDNHMICTLFLDGKTYYLDATEKGIPLGAYAHRIQGQDVLIEDGTNYIISSVPEYKSDYNLNITTLNLELKNNVLSGSGSQEFNGEENTHLYRYLLSTPELEREKEIADNIAYHDKNVKISSIVTTDVENRNIPIEITYNISIDNQVTSFDNELYLNTEYAKEYGNSDVEEDRINDLSFSHKHHTERVQYIKIPNTYRVDYLPEKIDIDNSDFRVSLIYSFDEISYKLMYTKKIIIKEGSISASNIKEWNDTLEKLNEFYSDQVILIKK